MQEIDSRVLDICSLQSCLAFSSVEYSCVPDTGYSQSKFAKYSQCTYTLG